MKVDINKFELHNMERQLGGVLKTRKAFLDFGLGAPGGTIIAGFSIESASTTEVWHYVFAQTDGIVTLYVLTEEMQPLFDLPLGPMGPAPVITWGLTNNQVMVNSPSFSAPLYGLPGGGMITAVKTASIQPDTTALDIPAGHIASFGDRFAIASGNNVFFNDPPGANGLDPRTFVAENILAVPGSVYDLFQAADGQLWMFTSAGVYTIAADALGQGQQIQGFLSRVPGIETSKPRNACATPFGVVVLQRDCIMVIGGSSQRIDLSPYNGRRRYTAVLDVDDLRQFGEVYATPDGFIVGFGSARPFVLNVNMKTNTVSRDYINDSSNTIALRGVLRSRDGEWMMLTPTACIQPQCVGTYDLLTVSRVLGAACGPFDVAGEPRVRRMTVASANPGATNSITVNGSTSDMTTTTLNGDVVVGVSEWSDTGNFAGRTTRTMRQTLNVRTTNPQAEVVFRGGGVEVATEMDVELGGTARSYRRDKQVSG